VLFNLRKIGNRPELNLNDGDILINPKFREFIRPHEPVKNIPSDYSLHAYCEILYRDIKCQIYVCNKLVKLTPFYNKLSVKKAYTWKIIPNGKINARCIVGFSKDAFSNNLCGAMLYHRHRLICSYYRIGIQREQNQLGIGVIGVMDADFLIPGHNKQEFQANYQYDLTIKMIAKAFRGYWYETIDHGEDTHKHIQELKGDEPMFFWIQCNSCQKWRKLPEELNKPGEWYCKDNPDPDNNSCIAVEEYHDENDVILDQQETSDISHPIKRKTPGKSKKIIPPEMPAPPKFNETIAEPDDSSEEERPVTKKKKIVDETEEKTQKAEVPKPLRKSNLPWEGRIEIKDAEKGWRYITSLQSVDHTVPLPSCLRIQKNLHAKDHRNSPVAFHLEISSTKAREEHEFKTYFGTFLGKHQRAPLVSVGKDSIVILPPTIEDVESFSSLSKLECVLLTKENLKKYLSS